MAPTIKNALACSFKRLDGTLLGPQDLELSILENNSDISLSSTGARKIEREQIRRYVDEARKRNRDDESEHRWTVKGFPRKQLF